MLLFEMPPNPRAMEVLDPKYWQGWQQTVFNFETWVSPINILMPIGHVIQA